MDNIIKSFTSPQTEKNIRDVSIVCLVDTYKLSSYLQPSDYQEELTGPKLISIDVGSPLVQYLTGSEELKIIYGESDVTLRVLTDFIITS